MGRVRVRPLTPSRLVAELADRIVAHAPTQRITVALDGAEAAGPQRWADALVDPLRVRGRAARHIRADDFLRPASLRYELGRTDPESFYQRWVDFDALRREVLNQLDGGQVLPSLWDPEADRATRAGYVPVPPAGVVLISGPLLLGALAFDLTVHLLLSPGALQRRTPPQRHWTLPAYAWYEAQVAPQAWADVVIRADDPDRPAIVDAW